jgi:hypothetical protein
MSRSDYDLPKITGTMSMTQLKNRLIKIDPSLKVELRNVRINGQLQGCSGFVTNLATGKIGYICTDCNHGTSLNNAYYRTAEHTRDFRGGMNRFASYDELPQSVVDLLK